MYLQVRGQETSCTGNYTVEIRKTVSFERENMCRTFFLFIFFSYDEMCTETKAYSGEQSGKRKLSSSFMRHTGF